jgi:hypothetical protein
MNTLTRGLRFTLGSGKLYVRPANRHNLTRFSVGQVEFDVLLLMLDVHIHNEDYYLVRSP